MSLRLYDTYERRLREFKPLEGNRVGLYACGPTVYNYAHIGNLRTYVFEDILRRALEYHGFEVEHVVNITDVGHLTDDADDGEDKMEVSARRTGRSAAEMAKHYTEAFQADLAALRVCPPKIWCKATDHIPEQIAFIQELADKGYTYKTADGIYFDSTRLNDYGRLARLDIQGLRAGARVEQGGRRAATDFALWKFSPKDEQRQMEWDSPWGIGFPGWHIECSAMSAKYLGDFFDIHCGGEDHIPIHHTNEIAQTEAARGTRLANFWMHGYFLQLGDEKMAKSAGEFIRLESLDEKGYDPLVYRYFCLQAHYRSQQSFSWQGIEAAATALGRLRQLCHDWREGAGEGRADIDLVGRFEAFLDDDLNMPRALALVWDVTRADLGDADKRATVLHFDQIFGLDLEHWTPVEVIVPGEVEDWLQERESARKERRWADADALRDRIEAAGFVVEDTPSGPRTKPKGTAN